ncbi:MAG: lytic transglycosylase domain-containing protein [Azonexus sp.]|nr:lytic transglycosylase domain-containing protein [Azonexus sp.]
MPVMRYAVPILACVLLASAHAGEESYAKYQHCFEQSAKRYGLHALELAAHACVESSMRADAVNDQHSSRTQSVDLGIMQINSRWLAKLEPSGVTRETLLNDACTNIDIGAAILADLKSRHGDSWDATGAYNAACTQLKGEACTQARSRYAWRVYAQMHALMERGACS